MNTKDLTLAIALCAAALAGAAALAPQTAAAADPAPAVAAAEDGAWLSDFDAAKKQAAEQKKDLLVDFSGSDWCGWCIKLNKEVFHEKAFQDAAAKDFVLCVLDFPSKPENKAKQTDAQRARNKELQKEYGIRGFPTVLLLDPAGQVYAKTGYKTGGVEAYLKHLAELKAQRAAKTALREKAGKETGVAKAKLLDEMIGVSGEDTAAAMHRAEMEEIVKLDADNAAGLRNKYQFVLRAGDAEAALEKGDTKAALAAYQGLLDELKPTGEQLQKVQFDMGGVYFQTKDKENMKKCLDAALAAAPESKIAPRIKATRERFFPSDRKTVGP